LTDRAWQLERETWQVALLLQVSRDHLRV